MKFNEHALELSIMELFEDEGYVHIEGDKIHRERSEVLLANDLKSYLTDRYSSVGITSGEINGIIHRLRSFQGHFMKRTSRS